MDFLIPLAGPAGVAAVIRGVIAWTRAAERKRTEAMRPVAAALGWSFEERRPLEAIPGMERFALFGQGRDRRIRRAARTS